MNPEDMDPLANAHNLLAAIDARAAEQPEKTAMRYAGKTLSYDALRHGSNRLASRLRALGVRREDAVACCVERGAHSLLAVLGILKAGATLIPLDESHPRDRLEYIRGQNRISVIVSDAEKLPGIAGKLDPAGLRAIRVDDPAQTTADDDGEPALVPIPEDIAYIIYTSGSTGQPKGVRISHRALYQSIIDGVPAIRMGGDDVCAQLAALTFDAAIWEHLAPLYCGATLVAVPGQALATPDAWADFVASHGISWTYLPPAFFAQWIAHLRGRTDNRDVVAALGSLRCILFAGETLPAAVVREWQAIMGTRVTLMNFYGPTETTVLVCGHVVDYLLPDRIDAVPIGRPFGLNRLRLLNNAIQPCPMGVVGSLYITGPQLASGYVGDAELTLRRFVVDPLDSVVLYDSGDLALMRTDGEYVFVGRRDNQVKLRGKRIEIEEVEKHLQSLPGISAVAAFIDEVGEVRRLVACVAGEASAPADELKAQLAEIAPDYMVPHEIVVLSSLPLNGNGKIDRRAIREQYARDRSHAGIAADCGADPLERIWREVLGCGEIAADDHFFAVGGDSLLLFRALSLARQHGYDVSDVAGILAENTLAGWRRHLPLRGESAAPASAQESPRVYPLAPMQREMFVLSDADPGRFLYHIQFVFACERFEPALLELAFRHVIRCHPIARTVFREVDGERKNVELDPAIADDFRLATVRIDAHDASEAEASLRAWMRKDHTIAFDTTAFPLLRAAYLTAGDCCHLAITFFHQLFDGWSFSLLVLQVCAAYEALRRGEAPPDFRPRGRFANYAGLLADLQSSAVAKAEDAYWRNELRPPLPLLDIQPQKVSSGLERSAFYQQTSEALAAALKRLAASCGTTLHKILLTAYFMLFHRLAGRNEMLIGNTVMGRPLELEDADRMLGCFINILPIRIADASLPFDRLLGAVAAKMDAALAHNRIANEWHVHNILAEEKHAGMCWKVIFALDNFPESFVIDQLHWPPSSWNAIEPFDIALSVIDLRSSLYCYWNYRSDLFPEPQARALGERYLALLGEVCGVSGDES